MPFQLQHQGGVLRTFAFTESLDRPIYLLTSFTSHTTGYFHGKEGAFRLKSPHSVVARSYLRTKKEKKQKFQIPLIQN